MYNACIGCLAFLLSCDLFRLVYWLACCLVGFVMSCVFIGLSWLFTLVVLFGLFCFHLSGWSFGG